MFKVLRPIKDTYITNRVINDVPQVTSNVGAGGSLDLFKLYGVTSTQSGSSAVPNLELSRLLIKFDLSPLQALIAEGKIDPSNQSFNCQMVLFDVYGGQPTPDNFNVVINPLSHSFDEGHGRDVVFYSDYDSCNWLTASLSTGQWFISGCGLMGSGSTDYLTSSQGIKLGASQFFVTGEEDLEVDVTTIVSATLANLCPDEGFRITLDPTLESDKYTYFVKRFASRTAFNEDLRPKLIVRFDDSIQDDTTNMVLDSPGTLFLRNYVRSNLTNLTSGSTVITGSNSLKLTIVTPVSGGLYSLSFSAGQSFSGINPRAGVYSSSITINSNDPVLVPQWSTSGSITAIPVWSSNDGTVTFLSGSAFQIQTPERGDRSHGPKTYEVSIQGLREKLLSTEQLVLRLNIFDYSTPYVKRAVKLPVEMPGIVVRDVHYQVRDVVTKRIEIPFDTIFNSTRASNDSSGMYFKLDTSNLTCGRNYVIDVLIVEGEGQQYYEAASTAFRVGVSG